MSLTALTSWKGWGLRTLKVFAILKESQDITFKQNDRYERKRQMQPAQRNPQADSR